MNQAIWKILIEQIVVPEIAAIIRAFTAGSGGTPPTDAQVIALFRFDVDKGIAMGQAFLAATAPSQPPQG
jgi:hypothetical protein